MLFKFDSDKKFILFYFCSIILAGSVLLSLPFAWNGQNSLLWIDALFTATSAVCVTGLSTVDTADFSLFGQIIIMLLIQTGGLGIIAFATIYLVNPRRKISLMDKGMIKDFYLDEVEKRPRKIIRDILVLTLAIEGIGTMLLSFRFGGYPRGAFHALFHSVSAFCNAGFSTFGSSSLENYVADPLVNLTIVSLILCGGMGFIVMRDVGNRIAGRRFRLSPHSRTVLAVSSVLVVVGTMLYAFLERDASMRGMDPGTRFLASLFQSVTTRTAGFDTIAQNRFSQGSVLVTILLMFIGASPASTGGGIKTTTFFILVLAAFREPDTYDRIKLGRRSIPATKVLKASSIAVKGLLIILLSSVAILAAQVAAGSRFNLLEIFFESVSAFATVGLSLGITPMLPASAKFILVLTMFAGRVGLFAMSLPRPERAIERYAGQPTTDLLIG